MKAVFSTQARDGLREIALFIARDDPMRALSFVRALRLKAQEIADAPHAFPIVPRFERHGIRRRAWHDYLIFYRIEDDGIAIVHVMHGARDYEALLSQAP
jgi:toxin ParE1/3/4